MHALGIAYNDGVESLFTGTVLERDYNKAAEWFTKAAALGDVDAGARLQQLKEHAKEHLAHQHQ